MIEYKKILVKTLLDNDNNLTNLIEFYNVLAETEDIY